MKFSHSFHIVDHSPWPIINSINVMNLFISLINLIKFPIIKNKIIMIMMLLLMMISMFIWWQSINRESSFQGNHTLNVLTGLKMSMILFILSELMFFLSFFWTFFYFSLAPDWEISNNWPPMGVFSINPYYMPLLNTSLLLSSGASITYSHYMIFMKNYKMAMFNLILTIILGLNFTILQMYEYMNLNFSLNDSSFGSIFFMATGFHGLHVIIGSIFLMVSFNRLFMNYFNNIHHFNFEAATWYWHFVDVIWIYLYIFMYWWFF